MPKVRIAQIMGKWLGGGVEAVVMNYYRNIDRERIQFDFICDGDSTDIPKEEIEKLGGRVILVPPYQDLIRYQKELRRIFKENQYKIVHSHINTLSVFPLRMAKKNGIPIRIAHSHSTTNKKEWKKNLVKQALRPFSKIYATDYFACGEYAGKWLFGEKEFARGNVTVVKNAIDLDKFRYNEDSRRKLKKELGISEDQIVVGHIGRFVAQKNHDFLIDIFKAVHERNPNTALVLIGKGPDEAKIKEKVKKLGLEKAVKFLGQREDANKLYSVFDVFVLPSLYEGLPMVGTEAQACGLPCLFSDAVTDEAYLLGSTRKSWLGNSAKNWAAEVLDMSKDFRQENTGDILRKDGYDIRTEADNLLRIYERLLSEEGGSLG